MIEYREGMNVFAAHTALGPEAGESMAARAAAEARRAPPRRVQGAVLGGLGTSLALAAGALWWVQASAPVEGALSTGVLTAEVSIVSAGEGQISGTRKDLVADWVRGRLEVEVEPRQGVNLLVRTEEGTVRVVGTGFAVTRDALGMIVEVRHGKVAVACAESEPVLLAAGEQHTCLPLGAAGRLGRVLTLQDAGVDAAALLPEIVSAERAARGNEAIAAELGTLRVGALVQLGRAEEALAAAEAVLLSHPGARAEELHRAAGRLAAADCARALPHLRWLESAHLLGDDAPLLAACEAQ